MKPFATEELFKLDGDIPLLRAVPYGVQHILAMFVANLAPIVMGISFTFVTVLCGIVATYGYSTAIGAIMVGGLIYCAVVFVTAVVDPWQAMLAANPDWATGEMILKSIGYVGVFFCGIAMLCAVVSGINGFYMASSRLIYSMAYADALPQKFAHLTPQGTPKNALLFVMILALIAP